MVTKFDTNLENINFSFNMNREGYNSFRYNGCSIDAPWPNKWYFVNMKIEDSNTRYTYKIQFYVPLPYWVQQYERRNVVLDIIYKYITFPTKITKIEDVKLFRESVNEIRNKSLEWAKNPQY